MADRSDRFSLGLFGIVQTVEGQFATEGSGMRVLYTGCGWEVVFDDEPAAGQARLRAIDVTDLEAERVRAVLNGERSD